jgi:hypothetical protein
MDLQSLRVLHVRKGQESTSELLPWLSELLDGALKIDTCQRALWILPEQGFTPVGEAVARAISLCRGSSGAELHTGVDAYRFVLRFAAGLESEVKGETDVFGQLKDAWTHYEAASGTWLEVLSPWYRRWLEDTKEIRARHLQNVGGSSYGSLVRRLLKQEGALPGDRILLIGAGHIARSVAPWLTDLEVLVWNRTPAAAETLVRELVERHGIQARTVATEAEGWEQISHVILGVPLDAGTDSVRIRRWKSLPLDRRGCLIHLGARSVEAGQEWASIPEFKGLEVLFSLQALADSTRRGQIERAEKACEEKALLRGLGGSASLPHGWEDLASFAFPVGNSIP